MGLFRILVLHNIKHVMGIRSSRPALRPLQEFGELDGVCTFCEMAVPLVARLAEKLGLPGNTPAAVDAAR